MPMEIARYQQLIAENPKDDRAYYALGKALAQEHRFSEAIEAYQQTIRLQPNDWQAYHHWGDALINLERGDEAEQMYLRAISINPQFPWSHHNLGVALWQQGKLEAAIEAYRQALALDSDRGESYYRLGEILVSQGNWIEAATACQKAAELGIKYWQLYHYWGDALINLERWDEAVGAYQRAISIKPDLPWSYYNLGLALLKLELCQEAITFLQRSIELNPNLAIAHYCLGDAWAALEEWTKAIESYQVSLSQESDFPQVSQKLAHACQQRAELDSKRALDYYRRALSMARNEGNASIYGEMAEILTQQGKIGEALYCSERACQLDPDNSALTSAWQRLRERGSKLYQAPVEPECGDYTYRLWREYNTPNPEDLSQILWKATALDYRPLISLIVIIDEIDRALTETIESVLAQVYPYWELILVTEQTEGSKLDLPTDLRLRLLSNDEEIDLATRANLAFNHSHGEFISLLSTGIILTPDALAEVVSQLNLDKSIDLIYGDEDSLAPQGMLTQPWFKPNWCPDLLLCRNYFGSLVVVRRQIVETVGKFQSDYASAYNYDLYLRITEQTQQIAHIPKIIAHCPEIESRDPHASQKAIAVALHRRGQPGEVISNEDFPAIHTIRYQITQPGKVSIIIPTRNFGQYLNRCLTSIFNLSTYPNYEVTIIDNGSDEPETLDILAKWQQKEENRLRCLKLDEPFNYSRLNNYAVGRSPGEYLLFLNNDIEVITSDWIDAMVEQAQRPNIGAVGALLLYPDDTVQHSGVILGMTGIAGHGHRYTPISDPGYHQLLLSTTNYAAVTAACLMCRREVFLKVRGFTEQLAVAYNDVDFCLKLRQRGYENIFLPHVRLYHYESISRNNSELENDRESREREVIYMQQRWGEIIARDPYYSINLSKEREDYSLDLRPQAEIVAVFLQETDPEKLWGYFLDEPKPGSLKDDTIQIIGWAIGRSERAISVEIICNGKSIAKTNISESRPDVALVYPQLNIAKESGFSTIIKLTELPHDPELILQVILADRTILKIAKIQLRY
jgi:tetratricopeptide (TPR) repeat protein